MQPDLASSVEGGQLGGWLPNLGDVDPAIGCGDVWVKEACEESHLVRTVLTCVDVGNVEQAHADSNGKVVPAK